MNLYSIEKIDYYVSNINRFPLLTKDEERTLLKEYFRTKDRQTGYKIINHNLRFVVKIAHRFKGYGHPLEDLIQEGNKGLLRALQKFNPKNDIRFCSYAVHWIKAYINNYVMKNHSIVKFGSRAKERDFFYQLKKQKEKFEKDQVENVTKALAEHFKVDEQEILHSYNRLNIRDYSLNEPLFSHEHAPAKYMDFLAFDETPQDDKLNNKEISANIQNVLANMKEGLNPREMFIIKNRLSSDEPMTLAEIGEQFGISRERTRQVEESLVRKLQKALKDFDDVQE